MPTRTTYRRTLAPLLGFYEQGTATSGSTGTGSVICTGTSTTGLRFKSTVNPESLFEDKWLYRPAAAAAGDKDRLIKTYAPGTGTFTVDDSYTNAAYSGGAGEVFEVHHLFSGSDLNSLLNEGLKRCWLVVEDTFTVGSALTRRHSLATLTHITDPRQVFQVGVLASGESRNQVDPFSRVRRGRVHADGATIYLEGPSFNTTDTVYLKTLKRAYDHCAAAATPTTYTQVGLSAEADVAVPDAEWVAWAAILAGADWIERMEAAGQATKEAREARMMAAARFSDLTRAFLEVPKRTLMPLTYIGATR